MRVGSLSNVGNVTNVAKDAWSGILRWREESRLSEFSPPMGEAGREAASGQARDLIQRVARDSGILCLLWMILERGNI